MGKIEKKLMRMQKDKDRVLDISREMIRVAGKAITLVHARKFAAASACMRQLDSFERKLRAAEKGFEYFAVQAHQEYVEALAFYNIVKKRKIVSMREAGVDEIPYLLGLMDLVGELKREAIESIRDEDHDAAEAYYSFMKSVYDSTRTMRFANSLVPEFRRKQDTARIQIETTASEMISLESRRKR